MIERTEDASEPVIIIKSGTASRPEQPATAGRKAVPFYPGTPDVPVLAAVNRRLYATYLQARGYTALPEPFRFPPATAEDATFPGKELLDWDAVPDLSPLPTRVEMASREAQAAWHPINRNVARQRMHVIVTRRREPVMIFLPLDFVGYQPPDSEASETS